SGYSSPSFARAKPNASRVDLPSLPPAGGAAVAPAIGACLTRVNVPSPAGSLCPQRGVTTSLPAPQYRVAICCRTVEIKFRTEIRNLITAPTQQAQAPRTIGPLRP